MKRRISIAALRKRLPKGFALPATFDAFVKAAAATDPARDGFYHIMWSDAPFHLGFRRECFAELVPFLVLGDGGVVAFWLPKTDVAQIAESARSTPAIVHLDSEGQNQVVAANFDDFLVRLTLRKTGVGDIDYDGSEDEDAGARKATSAKAAAPIALPAKILRARKPVRIAPALRARFAKWCKANLDQHQPDASAAADLEKLARKLRAFVGKMLRDGLSDIYNKDVSIDPAMGRDWWSYDFRATRKNKNSAWQIAFLEYGKWKPVPSAYGVEPLFRDLLARVKHPDRAAYEVSILKMGMVSVDKDRELVIETTESKKWQA